MSILPGYLWKRLAIPLVFLFIIFLILALSFPRQGLFAGFTATFLGILVTVSYVDYVLRQHEKTRWARAKTLIDKRINIFADISISHFRIAFDVSYKVFNQKAMDFDKLSSIRSEMIRITKDILLPSVEKAIPRLGEEDWKNLVRQLRISYEYGDKLFVLFGNWIEPEKLSLIMEIQDEIEKILSIYTIFPDVIGVSDDKLPMKKTGSAKADRMEFEKIVSCHVKNVLNKAISLLKKLDE
jgi:hypothetical protein